MRQDYPQLNYSPECASALRQRPWQGSCVLLLRLPRHAEVRRGANGALLDLPALAAVR